MLTKAIILLFTVFLSIPFVSAQTDTMQEDEQMDESAGGIVAGANYLCEYQGLTRRVEINYESPSASVPCTVNYYKDSEAPGEVNTLWTADNNEGYCEEQTAAFIDKLKSWGWSCSGG